MSRTPATSCSGGCEVPLRLYGRHLRALGAISRQPLLARISEGAELPPVNRGSEALLLRCDSGALPEGVGAVLVPESLASELVRRQPSLPCNTFAFGDELGYLADGDVVRISPERGEISVLYRRAASANSLLVTERCDNYCVMCSQPPKPHDDSWLVDELLTAIPLMSPETPEIGITGGEPTLLGDRLLELVTSLAQHLPKTALHILSNGRAFASGQLARQLAAVRHPDLMVGIPLYSALAEDHDYVVQARGAYDQTVRGILALKRQGVRVEVRFVVHRDTYTELPEFARFVTRNLLFVDHVALMGLELMGFARANLESLWIDPADYQRELAEATRTLARAGLAISIFNHQLCTLLPELHRFARSSISDWKREYFAECSTCSRRGECGGFFTSSSLRRSRAVRPI